MDGIKKIDDTVISTTGRNIAIEPEARRPSNRLSRIAPYGVIRPTRSSTDFAYAPRRLCPRFWLLKYFPKRTKSTGSVLSDSIARAQSDIVIMTVSGKSGQRLQAPGVSSKLFATLTPMRVSGFL